jgi:hypothetical protein
MKIIDIDKNQTMEKCLFQNAQKGYVFYSSMEHEAIAVMAARMNRNATIEKVIVCNIKSKIRTCSWLVRVTLKDSIKIEKNAIRSAMGYLINFGKKEEFVYLDKPSKDITTAFRKTEKKIKTEASIVINNTENLDCITIFKTTII